MSMVLGISTATDATIERVLAHPVLVWRLVAPDDPDMVAVMMPAPPKQGFFARLFGLGKASAARPALPDLDLAASECVTTDLDKAWHGIHYLLTGSAGEGDPPVNFLVAGGTEVGDIDVGYGRARVFRAAEVKEIHDALTAIDADDLGNRYEPERMMKEEVYPTMWDPDPEKDEGLEYLLEYYAILRRFIGDAANRDAGIVISLT